MFEGFGRIRSTRKHSGDFRSPFLACDFEDLRQFSVPANGELLVGLRCNNGFVGDQDDLAAVREFLELESGQKCRSSSKSRFDFVENERGR